MVGKGGGREREREREADYIYIHNIYLDYEGIVCGKTDILDVYIYISVS